LLSKGTNLYRPRNVTRKKQALKFVQASGFNELKAIPIKSPGGRKIKLNFSKKNELLSIQSAKVKRIVEFFDKIKLIENPKKEVDRILKKHKKVKSWNILTGNNESNIGFLAETVGQEVEFFMNKYGNQSEWLNGLVGSEFKRQRDLDS